MNSHIQELKKILTDSIVTDRDMDLIAYRDIGYSRSSVRIVVRPGTYNDITSLLRYCNQHAISVTPWGGGTNLCGALTPDQETIALDLKSLDKILNISEEDLTITVQAGATIESVELVVNRYGLTFCHDPWSTRSATVGGALSLDSVGNFYPKFGSIGDQVLSLKVAFPDGSINDYGRNLTKSSASPALQSLFIGAEGTLGVILEATLTIHPLPESYDTLGYGFPCFNDLFEAVRLLRKNGLEPQSYIGGTLPRRVIPLQPKSERMLVKLLKIDAALFLYYDGLSEEVKTRIIRAEKLLSTLGRMLPASYSQEWWDNRHTYFEMSPELAKEKIYVHVFDLCVPVSEIPSMIEKVQEISRSLELDESLSHTLFGAVDAYTVALYVDDDPDGRNKVKRFEKALVPVVHSANGTITRTHGLGTLFHESVARFEVGEDGLRLMADIKQIVDPKGIMNPGVLHSRLQEGRGREQGE